jgi:hypothetical protein
MYHVALDMFADTNTTASQFENEASYEVMVWLSTVGGPTPLGFSNGAVCCPQNLSGITLYVHPAIVRLIQLC